MEDHLEEPVSFTQELWQNLTVRYIYSSTDELVRVVSDDGSEIQLYCDDAHEA